MPDKLSAGDAAIVVRRGTVLAVLIVAYTFNFIDRQIVGILAVPIKADLGLTDAQLGLMGGLAFALFYTALGIPVAMLADRRSRSWIMTIALTVWSVMTAACGLAQNFWQLFLARVGVGVGEAGGVAPAYSLISDYFPPERRARAIGLYSFGIPIGGALGIVLGGVLATLVSWRVAFVVVGVMGVLFAPIFKLVVREPPRGAFDPAEPVAPPPSLGAIVRTLAAKPSFWGLAVGASCASMSGYGLFFWLPSFFVRSHGLSLLNASLVFGGILLVGGIAGLWFGAALADRKGKTRRSAYATVPATAFLLCVPLYVGAVLAPGIFLAAALLLVPTALGLTWLGPVVAAVQHLVAPGMRATASAVFMFVNNLIGIGAGTYFVGAISDGLATRFGEESLRYAIVAGTGFYLIAAVLLFVSARRLGRDWHVSPTTGRQPSTH